MNAFYTLFALDTALYQPIANVLVGILAFIGVCLGIYFTFIKKSPPPHKTIILPNDGDSDRRLRKLLKEADFLLFRYQTNAEGSTVFLAITVTVLTVCVFLAPAILGLWAEFVHNYVFNSETALIVGWVVICLAIGGAGGWWWRVEHRARKWLEKDADKLIPAIKKETD